MNQSKYLSYLLFIATSTNVSIQKEEEVIIEEPTTSNLSFQSEKRKNIEKMSKKY